MKMPKKEGLFLSFLNYFAKGLKRALRIEAEIVAKIL